MKRLVIAPYDPNWPLVYEQERAAILGAIGDRLVGIEHVGSTSVPGLGAKPIVDILAGVPTLTDATHCIQPLARLGYHFVPEAMADLPDDRYFERWTGAYEEGTEIAHLHVTEHGGGFWRDHLLFRDARGQRPDRRRLRAAEATARGPPSAGRGVHRGKNGIRHSRACPGMKRGRCQRGVRNARWPTAMSRADRPSSAYRPVAASLA